jgi:predicted ATPase
VIEREASVATSNTLQLGQLPARRSAEALALRSTVARCRVGGTARETRSCRLQGPTLLESDHKLSIATRNLDMCIYD